MPDPIDDNPAAPPADEPFKTTVDTRDWIPMPAIDQGDYLDRPAPKYLRDVPKESQ
ncbi:MAG: hypothetical protein M3Y41_02110 [Pseudomonadota bacterium]|nr:hypothetical protein [Pseudomonadota bacterium]